MKNLLSIAILMMTAAGFAETPLTLTISPYGAALQTGSTYQFSAACTYAIHAPDDCTAAGGATWTTSTETTNRITVDNTGLVTAVYDPGKGVIPGLFVVVTVGSLHDSAQVDVQHPTDIWYQYPTPDYHNYADTMTNAILPMNVVVGSTVTVGSGVLANTTGGAQGNPINGACNWVSSDTTKATVDRYGFVKAIAPGPVTITCSIPGDWVWGTSGQPGWQTPGNYLNLVIVDGGTGNNTWYVRPDGGTPWFDGTSTPYGQCTGLTDAPYPGETANIWLSNHTYNVGDKIAGPTGYVYTVSVAGVSGTQHPLWTGSTITDNTVTWTQGSLYLTDQNCGLENLRDLWTDLATYEKIFWNPAFQGGDTVIVRQNSNGYSIGPDSSGAFGGPSNCYGAGSSCVMPTIPSGTATRHTRILGENWASCTSDSAKTLLYGTWGNYYMFSVKDSQYVDIECFEMTDTGSCGGGGNFTNNCTNLSGNSIGTYGIAESALSADINYDNLYIHGLAEEAIKGATGLNVLADHIHMRGLPGGGIDMDDAPWHSTNMSLSGGFTMNNSITEFVGCIEMYPVTLDYPYIECRDQNAGGYGDGLGTAAAAGDWSFDNDIWRYNYQDGLDLLHSGLNSLTVTNSQSYGNDGQQFKIGSGKIVKIQNNRIIHNCARIADTFGDEPTSVLYLSATNLPTYSSGSLNISYGTGVIMAPGNTVPTPTAGGSITLPANATTYVWLDPTTLALTSSQTPYSSSLATRFMLGVFTTNGTGVSGYSSYATGVAFCRASGDGVVLAFDNLGSTSFQHNTFIGYGATSYDMECTGGWDSCASANTVFQDNVNSGVGNTFHEDGSLPGLFYQQEDASWTTQDHNSFYGFRSGVCPSGTGNICAADPKFVDEPMSVSSQNLTSEESLDNFNFALSSSSPMIGAGTAIEGLTTDALGIPYADPPSMGALEFETNPSTSVVFGGKLTFSGAVQF